MRICYVDESGCTGALPSASSPVQPVFVLAAMALDHARISHFTHDFLALKAKFFPRLAQRCRQRFDLLLAETKGSDIRRSVISSNRNERRHAIGFLDKLVQLVDGHQARIFGRIYVKGIGKPLNGTAVYTSAVQFVCGCFQNYLERVDDYGIVIADSRNKAKNAVVSHSIFTQKFKAAGDEYSRLIEMPTFGHSENHVGLQACDLLCSALLFPIAAFAYCAGHVTNVHVHGGYSLLRERFGADLKRLQHRFQMEGQTKGGLTVSDGIGFKSGAHLFADHTPAAGSPTVTVTVGGQAQTASPATAISTITPPPVP
jgi:hypothetical protein